MNKEVMIGIVQALDAGFGLPVHIDSVNQKLAPPCFLIDRVQGELQKKLGNRYKSGNYFDIKYFTETEKPAMEYLEVEEKLYNTLEYIEIEGSPTPTKGTDMKSSVIDGVLHFFVNYNFHVFKQNAPEEPMQDITIKSKLGGE